MLSMLIRFKGPLSLSLCVMRSGRTDDLAVDEKNGSIGFESCGFSGFRNLLDSAEFTIQSKDMRLKEIHILLKLNLTYVYNRS